MTISNDKIDLESVDLVEDDHDDEEANKIKPVSPVDDKEITNTLIQQEAACIVINDDLISFISNSATTKIKHELISSVSEKAVKNFVGEMGPIL